MVERKVISTADGLVEKTVQLMVAGKGAWWVVQSVGRLDVE